MDQITQPNLRRQQHKTVNVQRKGSGKKHIYSEQLI